MKKLIVVIMVALFLRVLATSYGQKVEERFDNKVEDRFDSLVRSDFFAGFAGDQASLERGMQTCEKVLATDPKNGPAHVWHGTGLFFQSGLEFARGDTAKGVALNKLGLKEMDDGVALRPDSVQTLIPRGAMLISTGRYLDDQQAQPLIQKGIADYEKVLEIEKPYFAGLSVHAKGELMGGLADAYRRVGRPDKARQFLERITQELPNSAYDRQARQWLSDLAAVGKRDRFCLGCHVASNSR